jgi:hypothetical protein
MAEYHATGIFAATNNYYAKGIYTATGEYRQVGLMDTAYDYHAYGILEGTGVYHAQGIFDFDAVYWTSGVMNTTDVGPDGGHYTLSYAHTDAGGTLTLPAAENVSKVETAYGIGGDGSHGTMNPTRGWIIGG